MSPEPLPLSLYVHLPWCVKKCPYCDFNSHAVRGSLPEQAYLAALIADLTEELGRAGGRPIESVFFGGGTPSLFSPESIERLIDAVRRLGGMSADAEITLEANPGAVERGSFKDYAAAGVNRVSVGVQSFAADKLAALGRIHSPEETETTLEDLRRAGITNVNLDLMYGLPGQDVDAARADVERAIQAQPSHISHYQLTIEPNTLFYARPPVLPDADLIADAEIACAELLGAAGFERYEVSAYARDGRVCRHNVNYWRFGDYLGIGAGAHGKLSQGEPLIVSRRCKIRHPQTYLAATEPPVDEERLMDPAQLRFEFMLNGLRLTAGIRERDYLARTGNEIDDLRRELETLETEGMMLSDGGGGWRASERGFRFLNDLQARFLPDARVGRLPGAGNG